jgi:G5 domain.
MIQHCQKAKKVIDQKGSNGYRVKVYKNTYEGGKLISNELLYKDYYKPVQAIIKVGTKKASKPSQSSQPEKPVKNEQTTKPQEQPTETGETQTN